jgi:RNA polymerase sigma factor (sigma-70 family)
VKSPAAQEIWRTASTFLAVGASKYWRSSGHDPVRDRAADLPDAESSTDHAHNFEDLYDQHHLGVFRFALLLCAGEAALAEDAVSEALARVYPKWVEGRITDFGAYLRTAVANQVKAAFRHRAVERREAERLWAEDQGTLVFDEHVDQRDQLSEALRELPLKQRTAVVLHYYEDRPITEIAQIMRTSKGTVKAHLSRGRARLRQLLEGKDLQ